MPQGIPKDSTLPSGRAKLWLLLVGISGYCDDVLPPLRYSALDCQGLSEALNAATQALPKKEAIVHHDLGAQAPRLEAVRASLKRLVVQAEPQDTVLFYFSGHGVLEPATQQAVLCLSNTHTNNLLETGLRLQELLETLEECQANQQLVWLDACHSGNLTRKEAKGEDKSTLLSPTSQLLDVLRRRASQSRRFDAFLSCDQGQQSWEFPELGHGLFTYYLMRGLWGEAADAQGAIEVDRLYRYVYDQTEQYIKNANQQVQLINQEERNRGRNHLYPEYPRQTPKRIMEGVGGLVLGFRPTKGDAKPMRQALVVDGLSASRTTLALSETLRTAGGFELEYWPQAAKAWPQVRTALQSCLQRRGPTQQDTGTLNAQTGNVLLYLRGQVEQVEEGEAWLVLPDGVRIGRAWLKPQLQGSKAAQQIIVLDCPGAVFLADWMEELQIESELGQCLIAAASPQEEPEQFTRALLKTLNAKDRAGLTVAEWITRLQMELTGTGIDLHIRLSGAQGVIEVLPGRPHPPALGPTDLEMLMERIAQGQNLALAQRWSEALQQARLARGFLTDATQRLPEVLQLIDSLTLKWEEEHRAASILSKAISLAAEQRWEQAVELLAEIPPAATVTRSRASELREQWLREQKTTVRPRVALPSLSALKERFERFWLNLTGAQPVFGTSASNKGLPVWIGIGIAAVILVAAPFALGIHNLFYSDESPVTGPSQTVIPKVAKPSPSTTVLNPPTPSKTSPLAKPLRQLVPGNLSRTGQAKPSARLTAPSEVKTTKPKTSTPVVGKPAQKNPPPSEPIGQPEEFSDS